jgi:hypothetical protein
VFGNTCKEKSMRAVPGRLFVAALGLFGLISLASADEKVSLDQVPATVKKALAAKYPEARVVSAAKESERGKTSYEFKLEQGKKKWEATFSAQGGFLGTEETIKQADLPAAVQDTLKTKYPGAKIRSLVKETTGEGDAAKVVYEVVLEDAKGKREVQSDPDGKYLGEEK